MAANRVLLDVAKNVRRHGKIGEDDWHVLAAVKLPVIAQDTEAEFKFAELMAGSADGLTRAQRLEELERLLGEERLELWLAVRAETELARTRWDILHLYWEHARHPETAQQLTDEVRASIEARRRRLSEIGLFLNEMADPASRTRLDPLRQVSHLRLRRRRTVVEQLLAQHGEVFVAPGEDEYAVLRAGDAPELMTAESG